MERKASLADLSFQGTYDPAVPGHDAIEELYLPCLSLAKRYDRVSAYFSSRSLQSYAKGLHAFARNDGRIRFVFSNQISPKEMDDIVEAYKRREAQMVEDLKKHSDELNDDFEVANLSYLIRHGIAEVKIAFMTNDLDSLFHQKFGIFTDEQGCSVAFSGSSNETLEGLNYNSELLDVFTPKDSMSKIEDRKQRFEKIWNGTYSPKMRVFSPSESFFEELVAYDRGRVFSSLQEYLECRKERLSLDHVLLDVDERANHLLVENLLCHPSCDRALSGLMSLKKGRKVGSWSYRFPEITLSLAREIQEALRRRLIPFRISSSLQSVLDQLNRKLERRLQWAQKIKRGEDEDLWHDDYEAFRRVVEKNTMVPLKDFQMRAAYFHYRLMSSADYSVPGSGKTFIAYGLFAYLRATGQAHRLVVLSPLNAFMAWEEEGRKIFGAEKPLHFFNREKQDGDCAETLLRDRYDVYLFNYEFLNSEEKAEVVRRLLDDKTMIVFDEIHRIKNPEGMRAGWAKRLFRTYPRPLFRLALTGTPLPNSFQDIQNTIEILYSDDKDLFDAFCSKNLREADRNEAVAQEIRRQLYPTFIRVTKSQLQIPEAEKDDLETLAVEPDEGQRRLLGELWRKIQNPLLLFVRLIQASSHPALLEKEIDDGTWEELDLSLEGKPTERWTLSAESQEYLRLHPLSRKTLTALSHIQSAAQEGRKALLWCLFLDTIDSCQGWLEKEGVRVLSVTGRDSERQREEKIRLFRDGDVSVLVTNPNTLAESVSLHQTCHEAVYLEYGFNLTYLIQSKDRIHRVGLPPGTKTRYLFAITEGDEARGSSIDRRILERLERKNERMRKTIESDDLALEVDRQTLLESIRDILENP